VTEMVTGRDLVVEQIRIAANEPLGFTQADVALQGHAIECRINAEDPAQDFRPHPGLVAKFVPPESGNGGDGARVRVDTHVQPGYRIPPYYDSMLAKLVVWGKTREAAREGMLRALGSFTVTGVKTTIPVHLQIMQDPRFAAGDYDTGFIGRLLH
jgi:acetyl-CoA carboxylase, biotin carboxylase subunit